MAQNLENGTGWWDFVINLMKLTLAADILLSFLDGVLVGDFILCPMTLYLS